MTAPASPQDLTAQTARPTTSQVLVAVARAHDLPLARLLSPQRDRAVMLARQAAMTLLREAGLSLPEIGRALGRDHSTVCHGLEVGRARGPVVLRLEACRRELGLALAAQA